MTISACVVFHSGYGHTKKQAEAVFQGLGEVKGVKALLIPVEDLASPDAGAWAALDEAAAIIFGCPTYMGSPSGGMKGFMEATSSRWLEQKWADKLAAGFTNSGSLDGDKQNTIVGIAAFAAQHSMVWVTLGLLPGNNSSTGSNENMNRLGASLGAMSQSNVDQGPDVVPPRSDLDTARFLGRRVGQCALRWNA